jgi:hypothetical protein
LDAMRTVPAYLRDKQMSMYRLAKDAGITYGTIHGHVMHGRPLSLATALRLEEWSSGGMLAADILGLRSSKAHASTLVGAKLAATPLPPGDEAA